MFLYLANEIKEAAKKKAEDEKQIETIVKIVTKKINSGARGGGNFRGGNFRGGNFRGGNFRGGYWGGGEGFPNNRRRYRNNPY